MAGGLGAYASARKKRARAHNKREHIEDNVEPALSALNDYWSEYPGMTDEDSFRAFFADAVEEWNEGKIPSRQCRDYYEHIATKKVKTDGELRAQITMEEVVLGAGGHDDGVGVTDLAYDKDEWLAAKERDRERGIRPGSAESEAAAYVIEHMTDGDALARAAEGRRTFDVERWRELHAADCAERMGADGFKGTERDAALAALADPGSKAAAYVRECLPQMTVTERQVAALQLVRETWEVRYPNLHLIRFDIHVDEPGGAPHAHAAYIPFVDRTTEVEAGKRVNGPRVQCSMKQALKAMGFKNTVEKDADGERKSVLAVEHLRAEMRAHSRDCYEAFDFEIEDKGITREHVPSDIYSEIAANADRTLKEVREEHAKVAAEKERFEAQRDAAIERQHELRVQNLEVSEQMSELREELEDLEPEVARARSQAAVAKGEAANAKAYVELVRGGYEPPTGVTYVPPEAMPPEIRLLQEFFNDEVDAEELPVNLYDEDENEMHDRVADRYGDLLGEYAEEQGVGVVIDNPVNGAPGLYLVDLPEDFVSPLGEAPDEMDERGYRAECGEYADDVVIPRLRFADDTGIDPMRPQRPLRERVRAVEEREHALAARERELKREAVAHEVGYFPAVDAEGKDTIIALSVTDKGRADLTNPETRIETANRLLPNIRETHPAGTQAKDGRTVTGEFVPGYLFREAAADEREREAEQAVSEARAVVDASRRHDAEVEDWWDEAKRSLKKSAQQLAKDVHRFLSKAARQFQSSRSDLVRGIGDTFAKAAYQWGVHISSTGAFTNNPALAQIFDDDDHDEWRRVEDAKPASLDDELMGVFDEMHGHKSSTGKARANAQRVQAQRVSFAERWGVDIDDVDTTPSTADYDEPDF